MSKTIHTPHDRFFSTTFKDKEAAIGFLESYLPPSVVKLMDLSRLEVNNTHFVDESLNEYRSDLLYQVPLHSGESAYVYVLFEHQRRPDAKMGFRLLRYMVRIWEYLGRQRSGLPPIIPLVLSQSPWPHSTAFQDSLALNEEERRVLSPWLPDFRHIILDLSAVEMAEIQGSVYGKIALYLLKSSQQGRIIDAYRYIGPLLEALLQQTDTLGFVETLLRYSAQVAEDINTVDELRELVARSINDVSEGTLMTLFEKMQQEAKAEFQAQIADAVREKEQAEQQKEQVVREKELLHQKLLEQEALIKQLRDATKEPKH